MDSRRFDALARALGAGGSRRQAVTALLAGLAGLGLARTVDTAAAKGRRRKPRQRQNAKRQKRRQRQNARRHVRPEASCCSSGNCAPGPGKNLAKCCYQGQNLSGKNFKGANLSEANLAGANLSQATFQGANLSKACLVDATLTGAKLDASTNQSGAVFCRTTMPDGSVNDSGCGQGSGCCPTCDAAHACGAGQVCCDGRCRTGDCCRDAQCLDPSTPVCRNNQCVPCTTNGQCGAGKVCCGGTCQTPAWSNQTTFGSFGAGPSQFNFPAGVAVSGDGRTVWAGDTSNDRVAVWTRPSAGSTAWSNQTTFGSFGDGPSQFNGPIGVAVSADGLTVWVADLGNHRVAVWTRPNQTSTVWSDQTTFGSFGSGPSQFFGPRGVAVSGDGRILWVADALNHRISVWTRPSAGSTAWSNQTTFGSLGSGPSQFRNPRGVAVAPDGLTVWVADAGNDRISVWTRPNQASTAWSNQTTFGSFGSGPSQFSNPRGVAVAPDGLTVWVGDTGNHRVAVWTRPSVGSTAWANQTTFGSLGSGPNQFNGPVGVAIAADGRTVWVGDTGNDRISVWAFGCPGA